MYDLILDFGYAGPIGLILLGLAVLVFGGEALIRGASRLAVAMKISPLVVGLTIVAFCTSAPELAVSVSAVLKGNADIAVGNVVGSNICNICLILGFAALLKPIVVSSTLIRREIPLMIALFLLTYFFALSGSEMPLSQLFHGDYEGLIVPWEGVFLFLVLCAYTGWTIYEVLYHKKGNEEYVKEIEEEIVPPPSEEKHDEKIHGFTNILVNVCLLIIGIAMLVAGADMLVQGSVTIAKKLGVSELIIGLTILAVGTSLPELIVSILAAIQGKSDIAVGNVIGSNIFNILGVLGPTAFLTGLVGGDGLKVTGKALQFDMPIMILVSIFCIVICVTGRRVSRGEGVFLLFCYAVYLALLCVMDSGV